MDSDEALAYMLLQDQPADDSWWSAPSSEKDQQMDEPSGVERQASNPFRAEGTGLKSLSVHTGVAECARGCASEPGSAKQTLLAGLPPQHPSSFPQIPNTGPQPPSVFDQPAHQLSDFPQVKISFSKPPDTQHRKMPSTGSSGRRSRELSGSPSDCMEAWHMPLQRSSGSLNTSTTESHSAPAALMTPDQDKEPVPYVRPTVQTGMRTRGELAPTHSGGKRVLKTAEERKQHRMAKNRATAAASRKRKQAAKEDLLSKLERMEEENAHLSELLVSRDEEIAEMREQIGLAELIHTNTSDRDQIMSSQRGPDHVFSDMIDLA